MLFCVVCKVRDGSLPSIAVYADHFFRRSVRIADIIKLDFIKSRLFAFVRNFHQISTSLFILRIDPDKIFFVAVDRPVRIMKDPFRMNLVNVGIAEADQPPDDIDPVVMQCLHERRHVTDEYPRCLCFRDQRRVRFKHDPPLIILHIDDDRVQFGRVDAGDHFLHFIRRSGYPCGNINPFDGLISKDGCAL